MISCLRSRTVAAVLILAVLLPVVLVPIAASATPLAPNADPVVEETDMVVAGLGGLYDAGGGTITLSGIGDGTITKALLYWSGPTNSTDPAANAAITFAGSDITGTNIGVDSSNCFEGQGFTNSQAYRADVTTLVTGDGTYAIANTTNAVARADGASLIVFFDDGDTSNNRNVYVYEGNDSNSDANYNVLTWDASLSGIEYGATGDPADLTLHVANGQSGGPDGTFALNGTIFASGDVFSGNSVPATGTGNSLWDIKSWDIAAYLTAGSNSLLLTNTDHGDCLSLIVATVAVAAEDAIPPTIEPIDNQTLDPTGPDGAPVFFTPVVADNTTPTDQLVVACLDQNNQPFASGDFAPMGTTTITCTVADLAGNTASTSFMVTVASLDDLWARLYAQIDATDTGATQQRQMRMYAGIAESLANSSPAMSCMQLSNLDLYIRSQVSRRRISTNDADLLYTETQAIRVALGCESNPT